MLNEAEKIVADRRRKKLRELIRALLKMKIQRVYSETAKTIVLKSEECHENRLRVWGWQHSRRSGK